MTKPLSVIKVADLVKIKVVMPRAWGVRVWLATYLFHCAGAVLGMVAEVSVVERGETT